MYHNPQAVVQVNRRRSRAFAIERSVRQGCPLSPLLYVLALESFLLRLRDERTNPALHGVPFCWPSYGKCFRFRRWYHCICIPPPGYKGCEEGGWRVRADSRSQGQFWQKWRFCVSVLGGVAIPFQGPSAGVTDPSASSGCSSGLTSYWNEIGRKYKLMWMFRWESGFQGGWP